MHPISLIHRHNYITLKFPHDTRILALSYNNVQIFFKRSRFSSFYMSLLRQDRQSGQFTLRHLVYQFQWELDPKLHKEYEENKRHRSVIWPLAFSFCLLASTHYSDITYSTTDCYQSPINLSVCMSARVHRVNRGAGMLIRCAVTSHAWFHSNYWSALTVIRTPVGKTALTVVS